MRSSLTIVSIAAMLLMCGTGVRAWDVFYDASTGVLPTSASPAWTLIAHSDPVLTASGGILRMTHNGGPGSVVLFFREMSEIPAGVPITLEARLRVAPSASGPVRLGMCSASYMGYLDVYPDHISTRLPDASTITYSSDCIAFRTVRFAYDGATKAYSWIDGQSAFEWGKSLPYNLPSGISFGSADEYTYFDSYWEYVAYSKEFLPLPEPSSLLALAAGVGGMGMVVRRRKLG